MGVDQTGAACWGTVDKEGEMEIAVVLGAALVWLVLVVWYGGAGKPMSVPEKECILAILRERLQGGPHADFIAQAQALLDSDDGKEFVMHNSVRYRPVAVYPPGKEGPTDPRAADRLYFKAALPLLLRLASLPIFVARCRGEFISWPGTPRWHYVALVRYRSRRDFFQFALAIERSGHDVYKWAAIEATHLMPVQAVVSFVWVRTTLALVLALGALGAVV
jgi:hypothetical protein